MILAMPIRALVICAGNIGRSPLAAALLEAALAEKLGVPASDLLDAGVMVQSAGTDAAEGHGASKRGIAFAAERGLDLSDHHATQLTVDLVRKADLIMGMDGNQISGVGDLLLDAVSKTVLWAGESGEIPDPHHESDEFFRDVGLRIETATPARAADVLAMMEARAISRGPRAVPAGGSSR